MVEEQDIHGGLEMHLMIPVCSKGVSHKMEMETAKSGV